MDKKPGHRFDFIALEQAALQSWATWDQNDTQKTRTDMFKAIRDLTYAVIFCGNFEAKYKITLGSDPDATAEERIMESAVEYSTYLFERIITRSKTFHPKSDTVELTLAEGVQASPETLAKELRKINKQPFNIVKYAVKKGGDGRTYMVDYKYQKFALQPYINTNLKHVILGRKEEYGAHDLLDSLEAALQNGESPVEQQYMAEAEEAPEARFRKDYLGKKVLRMLRLYYPTSEIKRLFSITCELLYKNDKALRDMNLPTDIQDFALIMMGLAKRIARENQSFDHRKVKKKDYEAALSTSVRSSVFLSSVINTQYFDRELLLSLDLESLYRLSTLIGGKKVQIPTLREMDTLVGACASISDALIKGKDPAVAIRENKADLGLVFSHKVNIKSFVEAALETHSIFGEEKNTVPLVAVLLSSIKSLETAFEAMLESSKEAGPADLARLYQEMVASTTRFSESLVNYANTGKELLKDGDK